MLQSRFNPATKPYIAPPYMLANKPMYLKKTGNDMWIRTPLNATQDLVQKLYASLAALWNSNGYENPIFCPNRTHLLANSTAYTYAASWDGTNCHYNGDDICPLFYNGSYMAGGHGVYACRTLTVASHDKVAADLGSIWQDAGARQWTLVRILDATHLQFIPDFTTNAGGAWSFSTTIGASPLTHVSGATNTTNVVYTATAISILSPAVKNVTLKILLDGMLEVVDNTVNQCNFVDIVQTYEVCDPRTILTYMKANTGKTIPEAVANIAVTPDITTTVIYRYMPNGSCTVYQKITTVNPVTDISMGGVQSISLDYASISGKLIEYIPRSKSWVGSVGTWDFKIPTEIQGTFEESALTSDRWDNVAKPPFRATQILKTTAGVPVIGFSLGYSLSKKDTVDSIRKDTVSSAVTINGSSRKQYLGGRYAATLAVGVTWELLCFRNYFDPNNIYGATVYEYHEEGNELIVDIDFHSTVDRVCMPIPAGWYGKSISTLHSDGTITIHNSTVNGNGIIVSVTDYGSATLKIS
jgi:hypothetical protein